MTGIDLATAVRERLAGHVPADGSATVSQPADPPAPSSEPPQPA